MKCVKVCKFEFKNQNLAQFLKELDNHWNEWNCDKNQGNLGVTVSGVCGGDDSGGESCGKGGGGDGM